ncbi:MAG: DUF465 domain-containing protein [Gammaproteobacteria bacterium]|jgi:hypothetical protein
MDIDEQEKLKEKINVLKLEHFDLDDIIKRLSDDPTVDQLQIQRLKKRKLAVKDMIAKLQSRLIPDIEA